MTLRHTAYQPHGTRLFGDRNVRMVLRQMLFQDALKRAEEPDDEDCVQSARRAAKVLQTGSLDVVEYVLLLPVPYDVGCRVPRRVVLPPDAREAANKGIAQSAAIKSCTTVVKVFEFHSSWMGMPESVRGRFQLQVPLRGLDVQRRWVGVAFKHLRLRHPGCPAYFLRPSCDLVGEALKDFLPLHCRERRPLRRRS